MMGALFRKSRKFEDEMVRLDRLFTPEPNSGCWLWLGRLSTNGYGQASVNGKKLSAHRWAYQVYRGPVTSAEFLCHRCDNRACINPDHIFIGTTADNIRDAAAKGRMYRWRGRRSGTKNPGAKITEFQVAQIRSLQSSGLSPRMIGERFGLKPTAVGLILKRKTWRHLP